MGTRKQPLYHRPHGLRPEHQRLVAPTPVEHAGGEDVAALEIRAELRLVDRKESNVEVARHGLDRRNPITRIGRLDLFLAGDQRDRIGAQPLRHLVVYLAREQPQRQPDDARGMSEHALDREMGLPGVGRPKHGRDASAARAGIAGALKREGDRHQS